MPKGPSQYAIIELDFLTDPRVMQLTGAELRAYLGYWLTAVRHRREILLTPYSSTSHIAHTSGTDQRTVANLLHKCSKLVGNPLLTLYKDGSVRVWGVRAKHGQLKNWYEDEKGQSGANQGLIKGQIGGRSGIERDKREIRERDESMSGDKPPTTAAGQAVLSVFPELKKDPDTLGKKLTSLIHPDVNCDDQRFERELRRCRAWHEEKHPGKRHNWGAALVNWIGRIKAEEQTNNGFKPYTQQREPDATPLYDTKTLKAVQRAAEKYREGAKP